MTPEYVQKLINEGKIKLLSDQESLDGATFDVLDGVAKQISQNKIKVSDLHFENIGADENECFIFTRFEFLK